MVSYSHLSTSKSVSSPSPDLFADVEASRPSSPVLVVSDMAESAYIPTEVAIVSDKSDSNSELEACLGLSHGSAMKEIFQAAQHLSQYGSVDAAHERRKCNTLLEFIYSKGFSTQQVNDFAGLEY